MWPIEQLYIELGTKQAYNFFEAYEIFGEVMEFIKRSTKKNLVYGWSHWFVRVGRTGLPFVIFYHLCTTNFPTIFSIFLNDLFFKITHVA